jgi:hypothetical protein
MPQISTLNNPTHTMTIASTKNLSTGNITVTLSGKVAPQDDTALAGMWGGPGAAKPDGNFSWAVINYLIPPGTRVQLAGLEIKQVNPSLLFYKGTVIGDAAGEADLSALTGPVLLTGASTPCIYWNKEGTNAIKWVKYGPSDRNPVDGDADTADKTKGNGFGILLWSGAPAKQATLEIKPPSGNPYTVIVNWTGLGINN